MLTDGTKAAGQVVRRARHPAGRSPMSTAEVLTLPAIGLGSAGLLMTPEEFDAIEEYDELYSYELVRGVLIVNPIPSEQEAGPNELLGFLLNLYREQHLQGAALDATLLERYV